MSTTNGSGEPSMEEILASIRNIIAQDPPSENPDLQSAVADGAEQGRGGAPGASEAKGGSPLTAEPASRNGSNIDLRNSAAAALLPPEPDIAESSPVPPAGVPEKAPAAGADEAPARPTPVADDFSDVFEEPLQGLPVTPAFTATPEAGGTVPESSDGNEPATPKLESSPPVADAPPAPQRKEFDFGALRAPPKDDGERISSGNSLFGRDKTASLGEDKPGNSSSSIFERLTTTGSKPTETQDESGEASRQKVVIAAMPAAPAPASAASEPSPQDAGADQLEAPELNESAAADVQAEAEEAGDAARTSNVGFLTGGSRLSEPPDYPKTVFPKFSEAPSKNDAGPGGEETVVEAAFEEPGGEAADAAAAGETETLDAVGGAAASATAAVGDGSAPAPEEAAVGGEEAAEIAPAPQGNLGQALTAADVVVSSQGGPVRTLEDTVSELLRPLLREWLENNMPRIVENALRLEVADSVKKQLKGASNKPNGVG